ncbi:MAG TPA: ArsB/NhaD family transporter [Candidatus Limnocylindrales bacterium]|nr:ArsB/NhaD family transporter [Candidatus Limnocylindrales bacterium]
MTMDAWIAAAVFVVAYALIAIERWDRTLIAMIGGLLVVALGVIDQHEAFAAVDLNVIFLLAGMMVIASILARTGFFEWLAVRSVRLSNGHPIRLLLILAVVTAVLSAFLDNVTTVVLMTPVTLSIAKRLGVSPVPYLISGILASNIGGTATLIGDPPNILIGSAAGLGFDDFLLHLGPVTVLVFLAFVVIIRFAFRNHLEVPDERREEALERTEENTIKDRPLLIRSLIVTGATIAGFLVHSIIGVEPATIALLGAMVLMLIAGLDPHRTLRDIEWSTLFFFVGLFILVEAIVQTGIIGGIADRLAEAMEGRIGVATVGLLWFSAIASAIVDNIPYTATAIPIVERFIEAGMDPEPLWWALALGACLGGNLTIVGASANVVVVNIAARAGHPIRFVEFLRYGSVVVAASLIISTAYLWLRYLT